jgi:DHA1 family bicyclomycin/chloramphenicol resistance-like MFS transporter
MRISRHALAYITYRHVSPQFYGVLFAAGIVGIMATNQLNARMVRRFGSDRLMRGGAFPARSGAMSALIGASQYGTGILGSALVGFFADGTPRPDGRRHRADEYRQPAVRHASRTLCRCDVQRRDGDRMN